MATHSGILAGRILWAWWVTVHGVAKGQTQPFFTSTLKASTYNFLKAANVQFITFSYTGHPQGKRIGSCSFSEFENACERGKVLAGQFCLDVPTRVRWSCGLALPVDPQPPEGSLGTQMHIWVHTHTSPKDTRKCLWTAQTIGLR